MKTDHITVVPYGGLANRMRAIASAVAIADKLKRRLTVIWYKDHTLNARFSSLFETSYLPFELIETDGWHYHLFYEAPRKKNLFLPRITATLKGVEFMMVEEDYSEEKFLKMVSGLQRDIIINSGLKFANLSSSFLREIFRFSPSVISTSNELLMGKTPDYALQIRRTDNHLSASHSPLALFEQIVAEGIRHNPSVLYFLATDDEKTKSFLKDKFPDNIIINSRHADRNSEQGMVDAAAEFYIMSQCRLIYGSFWSSFSEIAALYGECELKVVKQD